MITTFIENSNHKNSKTFIVKTNDPLSKLCKNKLNFSGVKFFDNHGNVLKNSNIIEHWYFVVNILMKKFHSGL